MMNRLYGPVFLVIAFWAKSSLSCSPSACLSANFCTWSSWSSWTSCSATCGNSGTQSRQRRLVVAHEVCTDHCHGSSESQSRQCNRFCYNGGSLQTYGCSCVVGYEGRCCETRVTCPRLSAPAHGSITNNGNTYGTTVRFTCHTGYELRGSLSRTCRSDHRWSGTQPSCRRITCPTLPPLPNGVATNGQFYGDTVTFSCDQGYELEGTNSLTCQLDTTWSGLMPRCIKITCQPDLPVPTNGSKTCSEGNRFQSTCSFFCNLGFRRVGPETRTCEHTGQWSNGTETWCEEITCFPLEIPAGGNVSPPTCASQPVVAGSICTASCFHGFTLSGNPTAVCSYEGDWFPSVFDVNCTAITCNQLDPPPNVIVEPENCTLNEANFLDICTFFCIPGYANTNGPDVLETTCSAAPGQHNSNAGWTVPVTDMVCQDSMDPVCQSCPADISEYSANREKVIDWVEPTWSDNSGDVTDIFRSHVPGSLFYWGSPQFVYYIARDNDGNQGFCNFTVTVKQHACPYQPPPRNGALACDTWLGGQFCSVSCNRDFGFAREPESLYYCKQEEGGGRWSPFLPGFHEFIFPWPDCTRRTLPAVAVGLQVHYYSSDCAVDTEEIRQNFVTQMRQLNMFAVGFCMDDAECNIDNVEVSCGTVSTARSKREAKVAINVDFDILIIRKNNSVNVSSVFITTQLNQLVTNIQDGISHGALNITSGNITIAPIPGSFTETTDVVLRCSHGQVLVNSTCLSCPVGTHINGTGCNDCPMGFYQDKEAQSFCLPCPNGTTTYTLRGTSKTQCREFCEPGTQFDTTTATCRDLSEVIDTGSVAPTAVHEVTHKQTDNKTCDEEDSCSCDPTCLQQGPAPLMNLSPGQLALLFAGVLICVLMVALGVVMALKYRKKRFQYNLNG